MKTSQIMGVAASLVIFGVMGYMAMNESSDTKESGFEVNQTTNATTGTVALTEEEQKIKDLKNDSREFAVSNLFILKCAPCHGDNGQGIIGPKLYGKSEQEITKKLYEYKEGKVKNSMMAGLLTNSTDEELKSLANEISKFGK